MYISLAKEVIMSDENMKQIAVYLNDKLQTALESVVASRQYGNQSEAIRQLIWAAYKEDENKND